MHQDFETRAYFVGIIPALSLTRCIKTTSRHSFIFFAQRITQRMGPFQLFPAANPPPPKQWKTMTHPDRKSDFAIKARCWQNGDLGKCAAAGGEVRRPWQWCARTGILSRISRVKGQPSADRMSPPRPSRPFPSPPLLLLQKKCSCSRQKWV